VQVMTEKLKYLGSVKNVALQFQKEKNFVLTVKAKTSANEQTEQISK
jgi:sporulation protein YlmC with PRC-barrel domain